jgi:hypothetical protein
LPFIQKNLVSEVTELAVAFQKGILCFTDFYAKIDCNQIKFFGWSITFFTDNFSAFAD